MISLSSKTAKIIYSIIASVLLVLVWNNAWKVTALLDIQSSLLNKLGRDLIVILAGLLLTAIIIKPKEIFAFLGLNGNIAKGLGSIHRTYPAEFVSSPWFLEYTAHAAF